VIEDRRLTFWLVGLLLQTKRKSCLECERRLDLQVAGFNRSTVFLIIWAYQSPSLTLSFIRPRRRVIAARSFSPSVSERLSSLKMRSLRPFTVCAIASRHFAEKPELYTNLMHYAQLAAGTALISGQKSVEVCQAYILLSLYPMPARRWEDDRCWIYLGLAIR
jgi:hypothetical protein